MSLLRHTLALLLLHPLLLLPGGWEARAQAPVFTSPLVQTGYVGVAFSYKIEADPAAIFGADGLPSGLSLLQGRISGTPLGPADTTNTVVLTATNIYSSSDVSTTNLTLVILPATPSPVITSDAAATGYIGEPFSYTIVASNATGYGAYPLPAGWTVDSASGVIASTPMTTGSQSITLVASNATSVPGTKTLTVTILAMATTNAIVNEHFEEGSGAEWQVGDANSSGTPAYWATVPTHFAGIMAAEGEGMAYCAGYGHGGTDKAPTYRNNMRAYLQRRVDLSGASAATLTFRSRIAGIETGIDRCRVKISEDNGATWGHTVWEQSRVDIDWTAETVALDAYTGNSMVWLRFEFASDDSVTSTGWFLDEIAVNTGQGDPFDHASTVYIATNSSRSVAAPNAVDVTTVTLRQGYRYVITATGNGLRDPRLWLYDADRNQLAYNDDSDGLNARITFACESTDAYYLKVAGVAGAYGTYTLLVTELPAQADIAAVSVVLELPDGDPRGASPLSVDFAVQNNGPMSLDNGETYSYLAKLYLSTSATTGGDILLGSEEVVLWPSSDPENNLQESLGSPANYTIPEHLPSGAYYVWLHISPLDGAPTDTRLANNWVCSTNPVTIQSPTYARITGKVIKAGGLSGLPEATILLQLEDGTTNSTTTDTYGNYALIVSNGLSGTLSVSNSGQAGIFWPPQRVFTNLSDDLDYQNFAQGTPLAISGTLAAKSGLRLANVTVAITGDGATLTTTTGTNGAYTAVVVPGWTGTITPLTNGIGGAFSPANKSYKKISTAKAKQNFTWTPPPIISGRVLDAKTKVPVAEVTLTFSGVGDATTDAQGAYAMTVPYGWSGTVTLSSLSAVAGTLTPAVKTYRKLTANKTRQDFKWVPPAALFARIPSFATPATTAPGPVLHTTGWARWELPEGGNTLPPGDWLQLTPSHFTFSMGPTPLQPPPVELHETQAEPLAAFLLRGNATAPILVIRTTNGLPFAELLHTNLILQEASIHLLPGAQPTLIWDLRVQPAAATQY